jgi:hypothetical protein
MGYPRNSVVKKWVMFVAAFRRITAMLRRMPDAASGWVRMSQTISARKRKPTILRTFTDNHRSASELSP